MARKGIPDRKDGASPEQDAAGQFAKTQHGRKADGMASANPRAPSKDTGADATVGTSGHGRDRSSGQGG